VWAVNTSRPCADDDYAPSILHVSRRVTYFRHNFQWSVRIPTQQPARRRTEPFDTIVSKLGTTTRRRGSRATHLASPFEVPEQGDRLVPRSPDGEDVVRHQFDDERREDGQRRLARRDPPADRSGEDPEPETKSSRWRGRARPRRPSPGQTGRPRSTPRSARVRGRLHRGGVGDQRAQPEQRTPSPGASPQANSVAYRVNEPSPSKTAVTRWAIAVYSSQKKKGMPRVRNRLTSANAGASTVPVLVASATTGWSPGASEKRAPGSPTAGCRRLS